MNNEIIFDTLYTPKEYQALPECVQAECVKVQWFTNLLDGPTMLLEDERTVGKVIWRGACGYLYDACGDGGLYAHKSQHHASMSANRLVVHHGYRNKGAVDDVLDPLFADQVRCVDRQYALLAGKQQTWPMNPDSKLREGDHALPGWRNHTVGTYYTRKLTMVKPYMADSTLEATDRMRQLLRTFYPRVVHPRGFAWISEMRWNKRKEQVEAKVLGERWLPVAHPGQDVEAVMQQLQHQGFVQWDITMLRHPQHGTGETFA
ncbi:hypothetical protein LRN42_000232 [Shigella sonnei]|nr:hypothetical protein [Shigella sonnei]